MVILFHFSPFQSVWPGRPTGKKPRIILSQLAGRCEGTCRQIKLVCVCITIWYTTQNCHEFGTVSNFPWKTWKAMSKIKKQRSWFSFSLVLAAFLRNTPMLSSIVLYLALNRLKDLSDFFLPPPLQIIAMMLPHILQSALFWSWRLSYIQCDRPHWQPCVLSRDIPLPCQVIFKSIWIFFLIFLNHYIKESYQVAQSMLVYYCLPKCLINLSQLWT